MYFVTLFLKNDLWQNYTRTKIQTGLMKKNSRINLWNICGIRNTNLGDMADPIFRRPSNVSSLLWTLTSQFSADLGSSLRTIPSLWSLMMLEVDSEFSLTMADPQPEPQTDSSKLKKAKESTMYSSWPSQHTVNTVLRYTNFTIFAHNVSFSRATLNANALHLCIICVSIFIYRDSGKTS